MAVATDRKTSTKLISVNSNEGLVSEKRTTKDVQRAAINNVNETSDSNNKHLPSSPTETVVIPIGPESDKNRPCSGSSILKRSARPSSGHSVKFVETETIITIQNASASFPISGNTSSNSDFNTSLGTINRQKPLKVLNNVSNKSCHETGIPPLSKNSRTSSKTQTCTSHEGIENDSISTKTDMAMEHELKNGMSSRTQYNVDENNFEENFKSSTHNHESLGARKLGSTGDKAVVNTGNDSANQQRKQKEDKKMAMNSKPESNDISLNSLTEKGELKGEEIQIDKGNVEGSEEYIEDMPNISNENMPNISSHQPSFGRTGERKTHTQRQVSFHQKKVIYNTDLCPTDGDMIREGYYQTKGSEIERRHIRHRDLKEIMAGQNVSDNEEVQFQDTINLKGYENRDIENRIPNIKTDSNEIPSQAKKRLHELYKELKRVREEIALMYSLEEADKERIECDKNSKNDDDGHEHQESGDSREEINDSKNTEVERENQVVKRISDKNSEKTEVEKETEVINRISIKDQEKTEVEKGKEIINSVLVKDPEKTEVEKGKEVIDRISDKEPEKTEVEEEKKVTEEISVKDPKETEVEIENEIINKVSVRDPKKIKVETEKTEKEIILGISVDDSEKNEVEEEKGVIEKISVKDSEKTEVKKQTKEIERISVIDFERTEVEKEKPSIEMMSVKDSDKTEVNKEKEVIERISFKDSEKTEMEKSNKVVERISVITTATPTIRKETNDLNNADETADNLDKQNTTEKQKEDRTDLMSKICSERNKESEDLAMTTDIHIIKEIKEIDIQENIEITERADEMEKVIQNKDNTESSEKSNASDEEKENVFIERVLISNSDSMISKNVNDKNDCITTTDTAAEGCSQSNTNSLSFIANDAKSDLGNKNENVNVEKFEQSEINEGAVQITGASASSKILNQDDSVKESKEQGIPFASEEDQDLDCEVNLDFALEEIKENISKDLVDIEEIRENFSDSAVMMSPMKRGDDDYIDYDDDLSDNDSLADIPKVVNDKTHKETTNGANKIIKDILCNISDVEKNRQFRKEFKTMTGEEEEMSCIVFCSPDDSYNVDVIRDINCINIDPLIVPCLVGEYELLVSSITQLTTTMKAEDGKMKLNVRLPFMKSEMKYFHCPILRWLAPNRQWVDIPSVEYLYEDEEGCILPILEADIKQLGIFAIVAAVIKEHFVFGYNVHEVSSAVDRETVLAGSYCPRFYTTETKADLMVIPIERSVIDDSKTPDVEDSSLMVSSSALVIVDLLNDPPQPLTLYILCSKPKSRPWTASMTSRIGTAESGYLSGSRIVSRAKSRESISHFLECWYDSDNYLVRMGGGCLGVKSVVLQKKDLTKDDKIQVTLHEKHNKYLIVEMKKEARRPDVNTVVVNLLKTLKEHRIYVCVAQRRDDPRRIRVSCDLKVKVTTRMIHRLERDHYIRRSLIHAKEGDVISVGLRGNITTIPNRKRIFRFYALNGFVADWEIQVVDSYYQRSLQQYCGFLQVSLCMCNSFEITPISGYEKYVKWKLLIEIPVTLPKDSSLHDYEKMSRSRIYICNKGPITVEFLRSFARLVGREWYNLARGLRLEHVRIQSIAQQNKRCSLESLVYDLLLTWLKRSCHTSDKAVLLASALRKSGRIDLAEEISELDRSYKLDYYKIINDHRMDKAIYLASKSRAILKSWRYVGPFLQLSQEDIDEIDKAESNELQKCDRMMKLWRSREEPHQGPLKLTFLLRKAGFGYVADHIAVTTRWRPKTSI